MDSINDDDIKSAIQRSGYLLENRVLSRFICNGFRAEANHTILQNNDEGKYREIDVFASKIIDYLIINANSNYTIYAHFLIECINNSQPLGLFENLGDIDKPASDWVYSLYNGDEEINEALFFVLQNSIEKIESKIESRLPSKQYCSFAKKKSDNKRNEWMAYHPDDFHKTLLKLTDAIRIKQLEIRDKHYDIRPSFGRLEFFIPIIVLQNNLILINQKTELEIHSVNYQKLKRPFDEVDIKNISIDIIKEEFVDKYIALKTDELAIIAEGVKSCLTNYA